MIVDSFKECCIFFVSHIPHAQVRFIPAFIGGIIFSFIFLLYLYKKQHEKSVWECFKCILKDIFISVPEMNHPHFSSCNFDHCEKCDKDGKLWKVFLERWECERESHKEYSRLAQGLNGTIKKFKTADIGKKPRWTLDLNLPLNKFWTDFDCFEIEKALLKCNFQVIKEEFDLLFKDFQLGNSKGWNLNYMPNGHWCTFPIMEQGIFSKTSTQKCPTVSTLMSNFPSLMKDCAFGNAFFSLLYPDSYIETYCGPSNIRLRCHFGLDVQHESFLEVDGEKVHWEKNECLIFDDSLPHSSYCGVSKLHDKPVVVLIFDLWHPSLNADEKDTLRRILSPF